jgi:hypothetical protein
LPLAVSPALWPSLSEPRRKQSTNPTTPLCEFRLRLEYSSTKPSQPAGAKPTPLLGSGSLQHLRDRRSTTRGFCRPATFRPQGLITLSTVFSLRTPVGFVSHQQRSWDSPFEAFPSQEVPVRFRPGEPTYRSNSAMRRPPKQSPGSPSPGFWALTLPRVPGDRTRV